MSAERCDGKPRIPPTCCWYDEDYCDATDPSPMPESCNEPATHWSCKYSDGPCLNACEKHSCRCAQLVNAAPDEASGQSLNADHAALMAAHAAGYAAAVADVVAFVRVAYPGYAQVSAKALWPRSGFIIGLLLSDLEGGAHVGAAKKGAV